MPYLQIDFAMLFSTKKAARLSKALRESGDVASRCAGGPVTIQ
jgi:hypothetical protein